MKRIVDEGVIASANSQFCTNAGISKKESVELGMAFFHMCQENRLGSEMEIRDKVQTHTHQSLLFLKIRKKEWCVTHRCISQYPVIIISFLKFTAGGNLFARPTVQKIFLFYWARVLQPTGFKALGLFLSIFKSKPFGQFLLLCSRIHIERVEMLNYLLLPVNTTHTECWCRASFVSTSQHLCAAAESNPAHNNFNLTLCKVRLYNSSKLEQGVNINCRNDQISLRKEAAMSDVHWALLGLDDGEMYTHNGRRPSVTI